MSCSFAGDTYNTTVKLGQPSSRSSNTGLMFIYSICRIVVVTGVVLDLIMMSRPLDKGQYEEKQYDVRQLGRELVVGNRLPREELIKPMVNEAEKQMEQIIYGFVYDLALSLSSEDPQVQKEISYFVEVLSNDNKFISTLQKIYSDRHKGFERGYILLTNGRTA